MKKFTALSGYLLLITLLCGTDIVGQRRRSTPPRKPTRSAIIPPNTQNLSPESKARHEAFDKVWRTIAYYYFDGKFNGVDWEALKFELEPKVRAAKSDNELYDILESMLKRLGSSHLGIIRPVVFETIENAKAIARERAREREAFFAARKTAESIVDVPSYDDPLAIYGPGIDLRVIGGEFVVFRVGVDSAAAYRGIKPGFIIDSIDDVALAPILQRVRLLEKDSSRFVRELPRDIVSEWLNGEKDSTVKIGYRDATDKQSEVVIRRELLPTTTASMGTDRPEVQLTFIARELDENTGYIHFDNFSLPVISKFCSALSDLGSKRGLIIDLRGNSGGIIGVSIALAGMVSSKNVDLGTSIYRFGLELLLANPKVKQYKGNVVILTDEMSVSAAEMFSASLQAARRARIIGTKTAGESLPSVAVELPTGARLVYPIANYRTADGRFLEGNGVVPDVVVPLDRVSLAAGRDPQIEAAKKELEKPAPVEKPVANSGSGSSAPPPPAPPKPKPVPRELGTVTVNAPLAEAADVIDSKSLELIKDFERLSGGLTAYSAIKTYEIEGRVDTVTMASRNSQTFSRYHEANVRDLVILRSEVTGETRTLYDGKTVRVTSDLGSDLLRPFPKPVSEDDILYSLVRSMKPENYKKLLYLGVFDRKDRKVHLIDGKTLDGMTVALYFDSETKLLAGFEGPTGGLSFGDYRKTGDVMFPYNISSQDYLNITLTEVKLNQKIDPVVFEPKINCFDKP